MENTLLKKIEAYHEKKATFKSLGKHWRSKQNEEGLFWLLLDKEDSNTNTLTAEVLEELSDVLKYIEQSPPKAVVISSAKQKGFCAGADIKAFKDYSESEMADMLHRGHTILDRLANLTIPSIAVIHGHCLGGGLELALACDMRIGIKKGLEMGFPEIKLGLHPGLGGTFRLTHLIDPTEAMKMMLTGKSVHDDQAKKLGLIDALVEERHVNNAIQAAIEKKLSKHSQSIKHKVLNLPIARKSGAKKMRAVSEKKAPSRHYPAPYALIDIWEKHGGHSKAMQEAEIKSFARLLVSTTAQNLIRVFFLQQSLKELTKKDTRIRHVHVIGAGAMGGDIAGWCAMHGLYVTLSDQKADPISLAIQNTEKLCQARHKSSIETLKTLDRIVPDMKNRGLEKADLIIEAVPEKKEIKQKLYQSIEPKIKEDAILATNTSSISLEELATHLKNPARFMGLHFFNPVARMLMVEVIRHENTSNEVMDQLLSFTQHIGKIPVAITSYPGFLVNRALTPYLLEAIVMLEEGVAKEYIDDAAKSFGMPMGPLELADQIGLDICVHVADMLANSLDKPMAKIPNGLRKKIEDGELGKKTGQGFYKWQEGKAKHNEKTEQAPDEKIIDRLILPMLDACVECYREGVVEHLDHLDGAMIFATGFAPFRGGPMHYARTRGIGDIVSTLNKFADEYGDRFKPDNGWKDL